MGHKLVFTLILAVSIISNTVGDRTDGTFACETESAALCDTITVAPQDASQATDQCPHGLVRFETKKLQATWDYGEPQTFPMPEVHRKCLGREGVVSVIYIHSESDHDLQVWIPNAGKWLIVNAPKQLQLWIWENETRAVDGSDLYRNQNPIRFLNHHQHQQVVPKSGFEYIMYACGKRQYGSRTPTFGECRVRIDIGFGPSDSRARLEEAEELARQRTLDYARISAKYAARSERYQNQQAHMSSRDRQEALNRLGRASQKVSQALEQATQCWRKWESYRGDIVQSTR